MRATRLSRLGRGDDVSSSRRIGRALALNDPLGLLLELVPCSGRCAEPILLKQVHAVVEHAAFLPSLGHAFVHHVFEVREGLTLRHRSPMPLRKDLVRQGRDRRRSQSQRSLT